MPTGQKAQEKTSVTLRDTGDPVDQGRGSERWRHPVTQRGLYGVPGSAEIPILVDARALLYYKVMSMNGLAFPCLSREHGQ